MGGHPIKKVAVTVATVALLLAAAPPHAAGDTSVVTIDSKPMRLWAVAVPYAFSIPATNVYRFEVHANDFGWPGDSENGNRRSEVASRGDRYEYGSGKTLWTSFSFVVGPAHASFDGGMSRHNTIHQWHSVDDPPHEDGRRPVVQVELLHGRLIIHTRSDATGDDGETDVVRYSATRPPDGVVHNVVISGLLGRSGHLSAWLDGTQIVNTDAPIGYYNDDGGARALAYPQWGIYQTNVDDPAVIYHANLEWGTTDLSARISTPLAVATPPGGWV
jgi:hypothetical protein